MRRIGIGAGLVATMLAAGTAARADVVHLKGGQTLEGRVEPVEGGRLRVIGRFGEVVVDRAAVAKIDRQPTLDEAYAQERALANLEEPGDLEQLSLWCRERGMLGEAQALMGRAGAIRAARERARLEALERQRQAALAERRKQADGDGEALYQLARWAEAERYGAAVVDALLREALLADPEHARARVAAELRRLEAEALADRQAAARTLDRAEGELAEAEATGRRAAAREAEADALAAKLKDREETIDDRLREAAARLEQARQAEARAFERERRAALAEERAIAREREATLLRDQAARLAVPTAGCCAGPCTHGQGGGGGRRAGGFIAPPDGGWRGGHFR